MSFPYIKTVVNRLLLVPLIPIGHTFLMANLQVSLYGDANMFSAIGMGSAIGVTGSVSAILAGFTGIFHHPKHLPFKISHRLIASGVLLQGLAIIVYRFEPPKQME